VLNLPQSTKKKYNFSTYLRSVGIVFTVTLLLTSCSLPVKESSFIGSSSNGVYAKIPSNFNYMDAVEFLKLRNPDLPPPIGYYGVVFAQSFIKSDTILSGPTLSGVIIKQLRPLKPDGSVIEDDVEAQRRVIFYDAHDLLIAKDSKFKLVADDVFKRDAEVVRHFEYILGDEGAERQIAQQTVISDDGKVIAGMAVGCTVTCFKDNQIYINKILLDWRSNI